MGVFEGLSPLAKLSSVYVVTSRAIRVIPRVLLTTSLVDVSVRMIASFYLFHDLSAGNVLSPADVVMIVSASRAITFSTNFRHDCAPFLARVTGVGAVVAAIDRRIWV